MTGLDSSSRNLLERLITKARRILEDDLAATAEGRFGIHKSGRVEEEDALRLAPADVLDRREVVAIVRHLGLEGLSAASAVERLVREATFTHLNRLVAIRIAESIGVLPPSLAAGKASRGFREVLEIAPLMASDQYGGYWFYLRLCADELAADAPLLFDPRNPLLALGPSPHGLDELVALFADPGMTKAWLAPDALGWAYQFFNTGDERREMREAGAPRTSRELAVRNQFFTPRYVVDFLVQNSLGRRLLEGNANPALESDMPLLVDHPAPHGDPIALEQVRVLDPACGSGHFLLGAYDLLEKAWEYGGVPPAEAAAKILPCLYGIDIDPRCAQVASAALVLRARRVCPSGSLPHPEVITARAMPRDDDVWGRALGELPTERQGLVRALRDALSEASLLGPLLKVEERMAAEIRQAIPESVPDQLWHRPDALGKAEAEVIGVLEQIADESMSTPAERLLAAETRDAVRFVEAMRRQYDVLLMNPPFGQEIPGTTDYLRAAYGATGGQVDLFAAFVARGLELCRPGAYVGAITSRVGMFLSTFETWRRKVLLGRRLVTLADFGEGVMEQAMVESAAYVIGVSSRGQETGFSVLRLVADEDRAGGLQDVIQASRDKRVDPRLFRLSVADIEPLPSLPLAYWLDRNIISALCSHSSFEPAHGVIRVGLQTSDDFQFVRAWWEVSPRKLSRPPGDAAGQSIESQLRSGARWVPIVKAGSSQPWFSPITLVVDWERDGERLRGFRDSSGRQKSAIRSPELYFKPGFSWTRRAPRLIPYVVPAGCIPSVSRYQAFPVDDPYIAVGLVASNVATAFCRFYGEQFKRPNFLVENVKNLPMPRTDQSVAGHLRDKVMGEVARRRTAYAGLEPFREFVVATEDSEDASWNATSLVGEDLDRDIARAYGLDAEQQARAEIDFRQSLAVQGWANDGKGGASSDEEERDASNPGTFGERMISYLVGVAFGRWDVRIGRDPSIAPPPNEPFEAMPACPPGMLVGSDGLPPAHAPAGYPLALPPGGVLVDELGNPWDIVQTVTAAANALTDGGDDLLARCLSELGRRSLREYLRRNFFKDHLNRYSHGRRQAPIYWYLSVPSRLWGIWVYAPAMSREVLFALATHAAQRLMAGRTALAGLHADQEAGGRGRTSRELSARIAEEEDLVGELEAFRMEAERVASIGWDPDLDDGNILCAAPLANLLPAWPAAAQARLKVRAGTYTWATVSKWAGSL